MGEGACGESGLWFSVGWLRRIRETRQPGDLWFALNPNCPEPVRKAIGASDDALAKQWLKTVDGWKRDGRYGKDRAGRWCEG